MITSANSAHSLQHYVDLALTSSTAYMLTIVEFIEVTNYDISKLYIDKFWASMQDDNQWIYVDDELLRWMGFEAIKPIHRKGSFIDLMKTNGITYTELTNKRYAQFLTTIPDTKMYPLTPSGKGVGKVKHILIEPEALRIAMLMVGRGKGQRAKEYYCALDRLFRIYLQYQCQFEKRSLDAEISRLRQQQISAIRARECLLIDTSPHIECVYFIRAGDAVKIGRTDSIQRRRDELQIGCPIVLTVVRTIITDVGAVLEAKLHGLYSHKHIHGEWYELDAQDIENAPSE